MDGSIPKVTTQPPGTLARNRDLAKLVIGDQVASAQLETGSGRGQPQWILHVVGQKPGSQRECQSNRMGSGLCRTQATRDRVPDECSRKRGRPLVPQLAVQFPTPGR